MTRKILALLLSAVMMFCLAACSGSRGKDDGTVIPQAEKNGQVAVLFTSDIHCAVKDGFGLDGLMQIRETLEAQGAVFNAGGIRSEIKKGDITYGDIFRVFPFGNTIYSVEVTGQQILDALEWGARAIPGENGGFLQVAGMSYEIYTAVNSGCEVDENGMCRGITGERRVRNVMVGEEKLDPEKTYVLASNDYLLLSEGDGFTFFDGAKVVLEHGKLDNQMLIDYVIDVLGGEIGTGYTELTGQGRITVID